MITREEVAAHLGRLDPELAERCRPSMLALLETEAPFSAEQVQPGHFTASAFVLRPDRRAALLIFHRKLQRWLQPGGHLEASDASLEAAARREVQEETGLSDLELLGDGLCDLDIHPIPARGHLAAHHHFDLRFAFLARAGEARVGDGVSAVAWVGLQELAARESDESVARVLRRLLVAPGA